jgi:hypothetical protein
MPPLSVVKDLEILERFRTRLGARRLRGLADELDFEGREEALGHGVVPAVAATTHAADDPGEATARR